MENKNKILEYIEDIIHFKRHDDNEGLVALQREGKAESVTLEDVGFAFLDIMDELTQYADISQALTEVRLKVIVAALAEETQLKIYKEFSEAEDDLFTEQEGDEINNGEQENN